MAVDFLSGKSAATPSVSEFIGSSLFPNRERQI